MSEMANSVAVKAGKRERLVESATALFHEQGVHRTTLAEVAERAEVPLGNVYYYFKTKDELVGAVLAGYQEQAATLIDSLERGRTPQARLKALVHNWSDMRDAVVNRGCPMGTLCAELDKIEGGLDREATFDLVELGAERSHRAAAVDDGVAHVAPVVDERLQPGLRRPAAL